ncbi:MAG: hypothetical protein CMG80_05300 [Marinobacter sp.]|nr:hypothetical protein [Marinobacter sp.]|tara:strand:+ start:424 stop:1032 length:609 start_codon:yes stop_codon:yes gene_type:complete
MICMEAFDVYRSYLALRLHFTTDKYDVIKQRGRVRATKQSFFKRNDLLSIRKIADTFNEKEVVDFLVANFVSGDRWGGVFNSEAKSNYNDWKRRIEAMTYTFTNDIDKLLFETEKRDIKFEDIFDNGSNHPILLKKYLRKDVSIETMVILNEINNYVAILDKKLDNDIIWPDVSRIIKKYTPFLDVDKEKYESILRRRIRQD